MNKQLVVRVTIAVVAGAVLWLVQPLPALLLDPATSTPEPLSISPHWQSLVWTGAAVAFAVALLAVMQAQTPRWLTNSVSLSASITLGAYLAAVLVLAMIAGVSAEEMIGVAPLLVGYMMIRFHGLLAYVIGVLALTVERRLLPREVPAVHREASPEGDD